MKSLWLITFLFLAVPSAYSQQTNGTGEKAGLSIGEASLRQKFDPLRDPTADLKAAVVIAKKEKKHIILDVGGEWCVWCHILDKYIISEPAISNLVFENYVWLKVNMSEENENKVFLSAYPEIVGYPHLFVLDSDGKFLHSQNTEPLEAGKSYDNTRFREFLIKWAPKKADEVR